MNMKAVYAAVFFCVFPLSFLTVLPLSAEDVRTDSIDAYILIDKSNKMLGSVADAADWICARVVDGLLAEGDRVTVWTFSDASESLVDEQTLAGGSKEAVKKAIRSISGDGKTPDIAGALKSLLDKAERRASPNKLVYVLVASSLIEPGNDAADKLLKYSRVEERPGWKALVVGVGIESRVAEATRSYMGSTPTP